jgi:heme/copper-type cytochrome/quinol oxidase subunit 4
MVRDEYSDNDLTSSEKISHVAIFLVAFVFSLVMTALDFFVMVLQKNQSNLKQSFLIFFVGWVLFGYWREIVRVTGMKQ